MPLPAGIRTCARATTRRASLFAAVEARRGYYSSSAGGATTSNKSCARGAPSRRSAVATTRSTRTSRSSATVSTSPGPTALAGSSVRRPFTPHVPGADETCGDAARAHHAGEAQPFVDPLTLHGASFRLGRSQGGFTAPDDGSTAPPSRRRATTQPLHDALERLPHSATRGIAPQRGAQRRIRRRAQRQHRIHHRHPRRPQPVDHRMIGDGAGVGHGDARVPPVAAPSSAA